MHSGHILDFIIFLSAVIIFIPIFQRFKINPLLAFIGAGLAIGPYGLKIVRNIDTAEAIGEIGLIFLLFTIGTEISLKRLKAMRKYLLGFGPFQVFLTTLIMSAIIYAFTRNMSISLIIGYTLSMSSTAVALRVIQDKGELSSAYGRAGVGTLLFQDLAVIPIMILIPQMAGKVSSNLLVDIGISLGKTAIAILLIWIIGNLVIKPLFRLVAWTKSVEAFSALVLLVVIGMSMLTNYLGLSLELGAFIAGMLVAETEYVNQVEADIHPYSGLLLGIFFLYVGMTIKLSYVLANFWLILGLALALMAVKIMVFYLIGKKVKITTYGSLLLAASMCQTSEFGFLVFALANKSKILSGVMQDRLQAVISVSMALTPVLFAIVRKIFQNKDENDKAPTKVSMTETEVNHEGHVLIIGYGKSGQFMARTLKSRGIEVCAIDADISRISEGHKDGIDILYGNASRAKILRAGGIMDAKCVVVTTFDTASTSKVLATLKFYFSGVPVYVLAMENNLTSMYLASGANVVVPKLEEGCIEMMSKLLKINGKSNTEIQETISSIRNNGYTIIAPPVTETNAK